MPILGVATGGGGLVSTKLPGGIKGAKGDPGTTITTESRATLAGLYDISADLDDRTTIYVRGENAFFVYDKATGDSANGGTIIADDVSRIWRRVYDGPVLTSWFGSDLTALNAAFAVIDATGGALTVDGPAEIDGPLVLTPTVLKNLKVSGHGTGLNQSRITTSADFTGDYAVHIAATHSYYDISSIVDYALEGLAIVSGGGTSPAIGLKIGTEYDGVTRKRLLGQNSSAIRGVYVEGFATALNVSDVSTLAFENCGFDASAHTNGRAVKLHVTNPPDDANSAAGDIRFTGCNFINGASGGSLIASLLSGSQIKDITFDSKCLFYYGDPYLTIATANGGIVGDISIDDCQFDAGTLGATGAGTMLAILPGSSSDTVENVKVTNNYFRGIASAKFAIQVDNNVIGAAVHSVLITDNWIANAHTRAAQITGVTQLTFTDNQFAECGAVSGSSVCVFGTCAQLVVRGNSLNQIAATAEYFIKVNSTCTRVNSDVIETNHGAQCTVAPVLASAIVGKTRLIAQEFGAKGDGTTDDRAALLRVLTAGRATGSKFDIVLDTRGGYGLSNALPWIDGAYLDAPHAELIALTASYTNKNFAVKNTNATSVIRADSIHETPVTRAGVRCIIRQSSATEIICQPIFISGGASAGLWEIDVRIFGFTAANGGLVSLNSMSNGNFDVKARFQGCGMSQGPLFFNGGGGPQPSLFGLDNDSGMIKSVGGHVWIDGGYAMTGLAIAKTSDGGYTNNPGGGDQSDGITTNYGSKGCSFSGDITRSGEAIDCQGQYHSFDMGRLENRYHGAFKFIHGAQGCGATAKVVRNFGIWAVAFTSSNSNAPTAYNSVEIGSATDDGSISGDGRAAWFNEVDSSPTYNQLRNSARFGVIAASGSGMKYGAVSALPGTTIAMNTVECPNLSGFTVAESSIDNVGNCRATWNMPDRITKPAAQLHSTLPTSSSGLATGDVYTNSGVLTKA